MLKSFIIAVILVSYASYATPVKRTAMSDGAANGGNGGAVGGGTGGALGGGAGGAAGASAGGAVGGALGSAVGGILGGSEGSKLLGGLGSAALGGLGGVIGGAVGGALGGGMGGVLGGGLGGGVKPNPCSSRTLCLNNGVCKPNGETYICVCPKSYSGMNCQEHNSGRDTEELDNIISGSQMHYDRTVEKVLERNKDWTEMLVVADVTKNMEACDASIYLWLKLNALSNNRALYYVFFNDGNNKRTAEKIIGSTGGIYGTNSSDLNVILETMKAGIKNGDGGDIPENDIEAIMRGIKDCPRCKSVVHIADNSATPRDLILLDQVKLPVKVIVCGAKTKEDVNPGLIYIADKTHGSIHTMKEDILSVADQFRGKTVKIGSDIYVLGSRGFKKVETL
ncbi:unnamed protein product [Didymodactylos carnosus]|uniref:EGF-like domain-containing protein n=1 Tax=Didymodactylos carnosus TaxID=1234261 RepID=A0A8S2DUR4_9BILA|nr:unnamed protein product [Didymodactylos carnosus]CAF3751586.1 unnamed protein product [Didymodactylos carnosus]